MRFKIVHKLAAVLLIAVALSLIAVSGVVAWNLTGGFTDYLQEREAHRLERFATFVGDRMLDKPSWRGLISSHEDGMQRLTDAFLRGEEGPAVTSNTHVLGVLKDQPLMRATDNSANRDASGSHDLDVPRNVRDGFPAFVAIVGTRGELILGRTSQGSDLRILERPIILNGKNAGAVQLAMPKNLDSVDAQFLRRQYIGVALAAAGVMCATLFLAVRVARRWSYPLVALRSAARDVALGQFEMPALSHGGIEEIAQLTEAIRDMAHALRRHESTRRQWLAQVSHELRTPLSVLRGEIESVEDGVRMPTRELVVSLGEDVRQLRRIVDDLHFIATADLGTLTFNKSEVEAFGALDAMIARLRRLPNLGGLQITVKGSNQSPVIVKWDIGRLEQVVGNLLLNSSRYTARPGQVQVTWWADARRQVVTLLVEDSAPGVDVEDLPQLFDPMFRADRARQRRVDASDPGGSGLGLTIVRTIVTAHGGTVSARSSSLGGLAVTITLPVGMAK